MRSQSLLPRSGSPPARPRVLSQAGLRGAATPLVGQSDLLSSESRCVEYLRFFLLGVAASQEHNLPRIARATSLDRSLLSPAGPTHDGHPLSHGQAAISSRVRAKSNWQ